LQLSNKLLELLSLDPRKRSDQTQCKVATEIQGFVLIGHVASVLHFPFHSLSVFPSPSVHKISIHSGFVLQFPGHRSSQPSLLLLRLQGKLRQHLVQRHLVWSGGGGGGGIACIMKGQSTGLMLWVCF